MFANLTIAVSGWSVKGQFVAFQTQQATMAERDALSRRPSQEGRGVEHRHCCINQAIAPISEAVGRGAGRLQQYPGKARTLAQHHRGRSRTSMQNLGNGRRATRGSKCDAGSSNGRSVSMTVDLNCPHLLPEIDPDEQVSRSEPIPHTPRSERASARRSPLSIGVGSPAPIGAATR